MTVPAAALVGGFLLAGTATSASANHLGCSHCGPVAPTVMYRTVHTQKNVVRYSDTNVYRHVTRVHPVITVTRVQPVINVHNVMRVHHHTLFHTVNSYSSQTQYLPAITNVSNSVQNTYDCSCGR